MRAAGPCGGGASRAPETRPRDANGITGALIGESGSTHTVLPALKAAFEDFGGDENEREPPLPSLSPPSDLPSTGPRGESGGRLSMTCGLGLGPGGPPGGSRVGGWGYNFVPHTYLQSGGHVLTVEPQWGVSWTSVQRGNE